MPRLLQHEKDYMRSCVDEEQIMEDAIAIYARRLESQRHYEYSPVHVRCGTMRGRQVLAEVDGESITGFMFR